MRLLEVKQTIGGRLDASRGLGQGFDFLRVALALGVVTFHTANIATGDNSCDTARFVWLFRYSILMVFFSLSGFLISGSALRLSLKNFLINRSLRIVPALAVEITLSALIIGPLFTTLPLSTYFTRFETYHYFTNIIGWIHYYLPGVFLANPLQQVNTPLWTVPCELGCYAIMASSIYFGLLKKPRTLLAFAVLWLAVGLALLAYEYFHLGIVDYHHAPHLPRYLKVPHELFVKRASPLFVAFTLGIVAYLYRYKLPYSWPLFWLCCAYYCMIALLGHDDYPQPLVDLFAVAPLVYIMTFLGVSKLPPLPLFHRGDYSYGIYIYGWPIMQVVRALFPAQGTNPWLLWIIAVPLIVLFAMFSWHTIELPILRLRKKFSFVARQRLAESEPEPELAGGENNQPIIRPLGSEAASDAR